MRVSNIACYLVIDAHCIHVHRSKVSQAAVIADAN